MNNKKQVHIKTIYIDNWAAIMVDKKIRQTPVKTMPAKANPKSYNIHSQVLLKQKKQNIKSSIIKEKNNLQNFIINKQNTSNYSRNGYRIYTQNSSRNAFPKRQSIIKNTNPFRFFLSSNANKKLIDQACQQNQYLKAKLSHIQHERPARRVITSKSSAVSRKKNYSPQNSARKKQNKQSIKNKQQNRIVHSMKAFRTFKKVQSPLQLEPWQQNPQNDLSIFQSTEC